MRYKLFSQDPDWVYLWDIDIIYSFFCLQDIPVGSVVEDEVTSELSCRFQPRGSPSSSTPQVISIGQLMESVSVVSIKHKLVTG